MMSLEKIAPLLFLFMWSSGAFFVKTGLEFSSVWSFLALRSLGSFCLVLSIVFFSDIRTNLKHSLSRNDILMLCLNGLLFQVLYQSFYFLSIHHALAIGLVALILGIQPLITPLFSKEKITIKALILLVIAFVGLFISLFGSKDFSSFNWIGLLFAFLAVLSITLGSTYQKKIDVHPAISALVQNAFASIIFLIISLCNGWHVEWNLTFIVSVLWMVIIVSTGALLLLFYMISKGSVNKVNSLFYFIPVVTMLFDYIIFQTPIPLLTIFGSFIIIISVMTYTRTQ